MSIVRVTERVGVWVLSFARPPINAIDLSLVRAFADLLSEAASSESCRAIVVTGDPRGWEPGDSKPETHRAASLTPRVVLVIGLLNLATFALLRAGFLATYGGELPATLWDLVPSALYLGLKFDARLAAVLCLPLLVVAWVERLWPRLGGRARTLGVVYLVLAEAFVLFAYGIDFGAYGYLHTRLNASLLQFLDNADIAWGMVWQTYPVVPSLALIGLAAAAYGGLLRRLLVKGGGGRPGARVRGIAAQVAAVLVVAGALYGKVSRYPLRWSDAFFSRDRFLSQLALNPVLYLWDTLGGQTLDFDADEARRRYPAVSRYLGVPAPDPATLTLRREVPPAAAASRRANVVIILLETFAGFKTGAVGGNPLDPSPHLDALARDGVRFRRFYTPMENTSRSIFALLFGIPDVSPHRSSSRNPLLVEQHTILNAFAGYDKLYFIGGSASWGNIRGMLAHNVEGLELYEEGAYEAPVHDVWGIADTDLLLAANRVLRERRDRPFVAIVQTAGNHRPFRLPPGRHGFVERSVELEELRRHGFFSLAEFNAFRFLDHAVGVYLEAARREAYFDNTLFVLLGDHGTTGGAPDRRFGSLALASFHVPLVLYGPRLVAGGRVVDRVASELDVLSTVAALLGIPHVNTTLGRNLFAPSAPDERDFAFTFTAFRVPPLLGLVGERFYLNTDQDGGYTLHDLQAPDAERDVKEAAPELAREMAELARGWYEMARYLRYHNPRVESGGTPR